MKIKNVSDILTYQSKKTPDKIAIFSNTKSYTYYELDVLVSKLVAYLHQKGIRQKDVCLHYFDDEFLLIISMLALARLGATLIAPHKINHSKVQEIQEVIELDWIISDAVLDEGYSIDIVTMGYTDFIHFEEKKEFTVEDSTPWQIVIGSGTTGKEKFFEVSQGLELQRVKIIQNSMNKSADDIVASLVRLDFNSTKIWFLATLYAGASYFIFDTRKTDIVQICAKNKISVLHTTVFYTENLLSSLPKSQKDVLSFLRVLSIGSSTVSENLKQRIKKYLTPNLYVYYGANEVARISTTNKNTIFQIEQTVGVVNIGIEVQIVDKNDKEKPQGEIGYIRVKSLGMVKEYFNDEKNTKKFFKNGWFYPGDLGKFTKNKELIYLGRADQMMILNGINIYPALIENRLLEHKEVEDVACVPLKDSINQDIPIAAVVLKKGSNLTKAFLINFCYQKLSSASVKDIVILEQIPRNNLGKLQRKLLQEHIYKELLFKNKKTRQATKKFTLEINQQEIKNVEYIDLWFEKLFGMVIEQTAQKKDIYDLSYRALFLIRKLLQICKIPVFYLGEIDSIVENKKQYIINLNLVYIDFVPLNHYIDILNSSFEFLYLMMDNKPTPSNVNYFINKYLKELISPIQQNFSQGAYQIEILKKAYENDIPFIHLGHSIYQLGWGANGKKIDRSTTNNDSAMGLKLTSNKIATANILKKAGVPTPIHGVANNLKEALEFVTRLKYPVVVKPIDLERGEGVSVNINDEKELTSAFNKAYILSKNNKVIIEKQVKGVCHRVFIAHGKVLYVVKRLPIGIYADGKSTISHLIDMANQKEQEKFFWEKKNIYYKDALAIKALKSHGYTIQSIPPKDTFIPLRDIETTQWGGVDIDVTNIIHKENIQIAQKGVKILGLSVAGVDIITEDISKPWYESEAIINEVNFSPTLGGADISKSYIQTYLKGLIQNNGRIPVEIFVGEKQEALQKAKEKQKEYCNSGISCYFISSDEILDSNYNTLYLKGNSFVQSCESLLLDSDVEALVVVDENNLFYKEYCPFDSNVTINIL